MPAARLLIAALLCCFAACSSERQIFTDKLDVKNVTLNPHTAFDIRLLTEVYGPAEVTDKETGTIGYWNAYVLEDSSEVEAFNKIHNTELDSVTEIWYLLLTPGSEKHYYIGKKYVHTHPTVYKNGSEDIELPDIFTDAQNILRTCQHAH